MLREGSKPQILPHGLIVVLSAILKSDQYNSPGAIVLLVLPIVSDMIVAASGWSNFELDLLQEILV
jgi:hypothetical protein